jgi:hypothetical protein
MWLTKRNQTKKKQKKLDKKNAYDGIPFTKFKVRTNYGV